MTKLIKTVLLILLIANSLPTYAVNICTEQKVVFGYFNGMNTEQEEADNALKVFKDKYSTETWEGDGIIYDIFYNQTKGKVKDVVEIFEQRFLEKYPHILEGKYEFIHEIMQGGGDVLNALQEYEPQLIAKYGEDYKDLIKDLDKATQEIAQDVAAIKIMDDNGKLIKADLSTYQEYKIHREQIDSYLKQQHKLLFVAYSQGNIFANAVINYAKLKLEHPKQLEVLHIAPASSNLNGEHVLSNKDYMIKFMLNKLGSYFLEEGHNKVSIKFKDTDNNSFNIKDPLGHALIPTYLANTQQTSFSIYKNVKNSFAVLQAPTKANSQNTDFSFMLKFEYLGNSLNFKITELNGTQLTNNYQSHNGQVGFLIAHKSNRGGFANYYASCDDQKLQLGDYNQDKAFVID